MCDVIFVDSPLLVKQVGDHGHEGLGLDLTTLLQLIQVQSELQPLGSKEGKHGGQVIHRF